MKVSCPTNGSVINLKASAEKLSLSDDSLLAGSSLFKVPWTGGTSIGLGKKSITASSIL